MIRFACPHCGAKLRVADNYAGHKGRCRECRAVITIPLPGEPASHTPPTGQRPSLQYADKDTYRMSEETPQATATSPPAGDGPICPGCHHTLAPGAILCVTCGVKVPSGRPVMTAHEPNLDELEIKGGRTISILSWIFPTGIWPVYSEATRRVRPYVTWAIVAVTIVVSLTFLVVAITDHPAMAWMKNLMLWDNDQQVTEEQWAATFRPTQLISHAFLHGGIIHLAGNMLFLIVFGTRVNGLIGNIPMLILYPLLAVAGGLVHISSVSGGPAAPMLGASGAIMGLCGAYVIFFPLYKVHVAAWFRWGLIGGFRLHRKFFAVPGILVVLFYIAFDVTFIVIGARTGTAHWAHLGGFLTGMAAAAALLASRLVRPGANLLSVLFGKYAWPLVGRPRQTAPGE